MTTYVAVCQTTDRKKKIQTNVNTLLRISLQGCFPVISEEIQIRLAFYSVLMMVKVKKKKKKVSNKAVIISVSYLNISGKQYYN